MKVNLEIANVRMVVENVRAHQVNKIIDGVFETLNNKKTNATISPTLVIDKSDDAKKITTDLVKNIEKSLAAPKETIIPKKDAEKLKSVKASEIPKVLPKINAERSLHASIGELIKPTIQPSNIREVDGMTLYQTQYTCDCGHTGKRYIRETNNFTKCHECDGKILVEPATFEKDKNGIPKPDIDGNFFVAREMYEVEGE